MLWSSEKTHLVGGGEIVVVAYLLCLASVLLQIVEFVLKCCDVRT